MQNTLCLCPPEETFQVPVPSLWNWNVSCFFKIIQATHWGRQKIDAILKTIFWNTFYWMKMYWLPLKLHCNIFLMDQLTISHHWFRWWRGRPSNKPFFEPMMIILLTHVCITRPQWVKTAHKTIPSYDTTIVFSVEVQSACPWFPSSIPVLETALWHAMHRSGKHLSGVT